MLVSGGNLFHHGELLGLGDPIEDVDNWRKTTLQIHLKTGAILDVSPEQAERLREKQKQKNVRAIGQKVMRMHERAKRASAHLAGQVEILTRELKETEESLAKAEQAEFEAADELASMRTKYGDAALGYTEDPDEPEPGAAEEKSLEPTAEQSHGHDGATALTADQLRAKAMGAVGGYTRRQLVEDCLKGWWGIDIYDVLRTDGSHVVPKGAKKDAVRAAAIAIFEARYRIAELVESLKLDTDKAPNADALLAVSLEAIGAAVPSEAAASLESWKDSIVLKGDALIPPGELGDEPVEPVVVEVEAVEDEG